MPLHRIVAVFLLFRVAGIDVVADTEAAPVGAQDDDAGRRRGNNNIMKVVFVVGVIGSMLMGLVHPAIIFVFASALSDLSGIEASLSLDPLKGIAYNFMGLGATALVFGLAQGWCFELVAHRGAQNFRRQWFQALLRQDAAATFGHGKTLNRNDSFPRMMSTSLMILALSPNLTTTS